MAIDVPAAPLSLLSTSADTLRRPRGALSAWPGLDWPRRKTRYVIPAPSGGELVLEVEGAEPGWLRPVTQRLGELLRLPANWDSYGAPPVRTSAAVASLEVLLRTAELSTPPPQLVPTVEGGLQLEWHQRGIDLEVVPWPEGRVSVYFFDHRTGDEWEQDLRADLGSLRLALRELTRRG